MLFATLIALKWATICKLVTVVGFGAIVTGPLFSLTASGQVGHAIVFSKWKGRDYVREYVTPRNPQTLPQQFQRGFFSLLAKWWATVSDADRATWQTLADANEFSTFNAYCQGNLDLESAGNNPDVSADGSNTDNAVGQVTTVTAVGGSRRIDGVVTLDANQVGTDALIVTLGTDGGANSTSETIQRVLYNKCPPNALAGPIPTINNYSLTNLPPGTYRVGAVIIGQSGSETAWTHPAAAVTVTS